MLNSIGDVNMLFQFGAFMLQLSSSFNSAYELWEFGAVLSRKLVFLEVIPLLKLELKLSAMAERDIG